MKKQFTIILFILAFIIGILVSGIILYYTKTYTIKYDTKGGSIYATVAVKPGTKVIIPDEKPSMIGYYFEGWYYNDQPLDESMLVYEDITIQAKFVAANEA